MNLSVLEIKKLIHFWCRINTKTAKLWWWWHCQQVWSYLKIGPNPASFCLFSFFSNDKYITNTINEKSVDVLLGTWIWGGRMVGIDESTELWRHPDKCEVTLFLPTDEIRNDQNMFIRFALHKIFNLFTNKRCENSQ